MFWGMSGNGRRTAGTRAIPGAPADGSAWSSGNCSQRVLRGGSWDNDPRNLRSAIRYGFSAGNRSDHSDGFRVARTMN